jgi:hypothetical protein
MMANRGKSVRQRKSKISELKSTVAEQQKEMETVIARVQEQAAQSQKVTAQIQIHTPAPEVALNP